MTRFVRRLCFIAVASILYSEVALGALCGPGSYLFPAPNSLEEFNANIVQSAEVFLVRWHHPNNTYSERFNSHWEKIAILFQKQVRLVMYLTDGPLGQEMMKAVGVADDDVPMWTLYHGVDEVTPSKPTPVLKESCDGDAKDQGSCGDGLAAEGVAVPTDAAPAPKARRGRFTALVKGPVDVPWNDIREAILRDTDAALKNEQGILLKQVHRNR